MQQEDSKVLFTPAISVGYGDYKLEAKGLMGLMGFLVVVVVVGFGALQFFLYRSVQHDIKGLQGEIRVLSYVLTQPEGNRPKLLMPKELRERIQ